MADYSNEIFTKVKAKCTLCKSWGQTLEGVPPTFPYVYFEQEDNSGDDYDLSNNENAVIPVIKITVYANGTSKKETARKISNEIREIFVSMGFRCQYGPTKIDNAADASICRYIARYRRTICNGDTLQ